MQQHLHRTPKDPLQGPLRPEVSQGPMDQLQCAFALLGAIETLCVNTHLLHLLSDGEFNRGRKKEETKHGSKLKRER